MRRLIILATLLTSIAGSQSFAQTNNVLNCDQVAKAQWARCVIERSTERSGE